MSILTVMSLLLGACSAVPVVVVVQTATPAPSATSAPSATAAASATSLPVQSDEVWDRIVANHKIVVGTSWDYPPFASVDPNFQVVGFDIALIREIGRRLKIPIDIQNFTFDGLPGALQLNQVDLAIAAIAVTPERAGQLSFSPTYYVNETAVLARSDSQVSLTDFNQLAGFRVGVRRGSVYESMVKSSLVEPGLMSADKLLSYTKSDEAIRDLVANRVDMVVIGQATAKYYNTEQGLRIVGQGFSQQDLAVAMRPGTPRLKAEIDRVMDEMLVDGTILSLIQQYLQTEVTSVLPTSTPPAQATATSRPPAATMTPPVCWDGMRFIKDVTFGDQSMRTPQFVKPGEAFVKVWRVQNTGTCTWTPDYQLAYAYGNVDAAQMNGQPVQMPGNVIPGQVIDLGVNLIAPLEPFTYQGFWQMENADGGSFGQTVWAGITTLSDPQNPPSTVQPPAGNYCTVTLTAPLKSIPVRSAFDAVWMVENISGADWASDSVDYRFVSGRELHSQALYDFTETVKAGETAKIIVDMVAPAAPGIYNTKWAIVAGSKTLCILTVSVNVTAK
jgi:polar amino acid transport system substrate-binding protein